MNFQYRTTVTSQNTEALIREAAYRLSTTQLLATGKPSFKVITKIGLYLDIHL